MIPEDLNYTKDHEWVRLESGTATIGISDHAQKEMGDLVFVELPQAGEMVEPGKPMGTPRSSRPWRGRSRRSTRPWRINPSW
jgi:glycine cleavage system H protein